MLRDLFRGRSGLAAAAADSRPGTVARELPTQYTFFPFYAIYYLMDRKRTISPLDAQQNHKIYWLLCGWSSSFSPSRSSGGPISVAATVARFTIFATKYGVRTSFPWPSWDIKFSLLVSATAAGYSTSSFSHFPFLSHSGRSALSPPGAAE